MKRTTLALLALAALVYGITSIPHLLACLRTPPGMSFSGVIIWQGDQDSYFSFIRQAADGHAMFINRLTHLEHRPVYFNLEWFLVGRIAAAFGGSMNIAYSIWRALGALAIVFGSQALAHAALRDPTQRVLALMCVFGGAFHTLFSAWNRIDDAVRAVFGWAPGQIPAEFRYFSTHPFAQILCNPHFALPLGVLMLAIAAYLQGERTSRWKWYAIAGVLAAIEGTMRPYEMIVLYSAIPLFIAVDSLANRGWEWEKVLRRALPLAIVAPVFAYTVCLFELHPVFKYWASQGVDSVQPVAMILAHTGLAGALLAVRLCLVKRFPLATSTDRFVLCWLLTVLLFVVGNSLPLAKLLPYSPQLITGLMPPVILLAVPLFDRARWPSIARRPIVWHALLCAVIAVDSLDDVHLLRSLTPNGESWEVETYTPTPEMEGYAWIDRHTPENDVVLCLGRTGIRLPKYASVRVIAGHWSITPHSQEMDEMVRSFFKGALSAEAAAELLRVCRVTRVYFGAREQQWGPPRDELMPGFERCNVNESVIVYSRRP